MPNERPEHLSQSDHEEVEELSAPRSPVIFKVISQQGEDELARPDASLFWSGIAAGISIMASTIVEGALWHRLPDAPWRDAVTNLGYSVGFLIVILGRMQLFTEQTIVAVLPVMAAPSWRKAAGTARLWAIVFAANIVGSAIAAFMNLKLHLVSHDLLGAPRSPMVSSGSFWR